MKTSIVVVSVNSSTIKPFPFEDTNFMVIGGGSIMFNGNLAKEIGGVKGLYDLLKEV